MILSGRINDKNVKFPIKFLKMLFISYIQLINFKKNLTH